jgi:hypothetical protein
MNTKYERLKAAVETEIDRFNIESSYHKRLFRRLRGTAMCLTGIATILGSVTLVVPDTLVPNAARWSGFLIVVVTVAAGAFTAIEGIRKPSDLWLIERNIFHTLNDLHREIEYYGADNSDEKRLDAYFARLQDILYSSSQKWGKNLKQPQPETPQQSKTATTTGA